MSFSNSGPCSDRGWGPWLFPKGWGQAPCSPSHTHTPPAVSTWPSCQDGPDWRWLLVWPGLPFQSLPRLLLDFISAHLKALEPRVSRRAWPQRWRLVFTSPPLKVGPSHHGGGDQPGSSPCASAPAYPVRLLSAPWVEGLGQSYCVALGVSAVHRTGLCALPPPRPPRARALQAVPWMGLSPVSSGRHRSGFPELCGSRLCGNARGRGSLEEGGAHVALQQEGSQRLPAWLAGL